MKQVIKILKHQQLVSISLIIITLLLIPINVKALVKPTNRFYVNDYADILSDETENYIYSMSTKLNKVDGTQIVVVTVENLENLDLETYSNKLFNSFGIGDSKKNNGLLLLLALDERKFRVEVGKGLEGILPDGKTGRFQDEYAIEYFKEDKWDEGMKNLYDAFYKEIVTQNNLEIDYTEPVEVESYEEEVDHFFIVLFDFFLFGFIFGIVTFFIRGKSSIGYLLATLLILFLVRPVFFINNEEISQIIYYIQSFIAGMILGSFKPSRTYTRRNDRTNFDSFSNFSSGGFSGGGSFGGGGSSSGGGSSRSF